MPKPRDPPIFGDFAASAAALLAERYARQRAAEPLLPEVDDFAAQTSRPTATSRPAAAKSSPT